MCCHSHLCSYLLAAVIDAYDERSIQAQVAIEKGAEQFSVKHSVASTQVQGVRAQDGSLGFHELASTCESLTIPNLYCSINCHLGARRRSSRSQN